MLFQPIDHTITHRITNTKMELFLQVSSHIHGHHHRQMSNGFVKSSKAPNMLLLQKRKSDHRHDRVRLSQLGFLILYKSPSCRVCLLPNTKASHETKQQCKHGTYSNFHVSRAFWYRSDQLIRCAAIIIDLH